MSRTFVRLAVALLATAASLAAQQPASPSKAPRLWTDEALRSWALPIAGADATPNFYSEAEYYAAPIDELRTYPAYVKDREPAGYRDWMLKQGPQPLVDLQKIKTDADWVAAGAEVFDGMDLGENRIADPRALAWMNDATAPARDHATITKDGVIVSVRWTVDRDRKLKLTLGECSACHTRVLPDGSEIHGAQGNINLGLPIFDVFDDHANQLKDREGGRPSPAERAYASYAVPWITNDINARFKTMSKADRVRIDGAPTAVSTFSRFNGSPYFTNHMPDLIGVKDRTYLDATATHRNRGPEDIARYAILVTDADDGSVGPYRFIEGKARKIRSRRSDEAMYALGKYIYALQAPPNPNRPDSLTERGGQVFTRSGCAGCHAPPLYTNNKLVAVEGFTPFAHPQTPPPADVMAMKIGVDPGLALRTRKGTGYYKVPSLKGLWYRTTLEHSGSIASLEEWFDAARLNSDYASKGWNPPDAKTRAIPGHTFGLTLSTDDKRALIAFLRTL